MFIPALIVLGLIVLVQRRRRDHAQIPATATAKPSMGD
jgi:hypothetical protein